jgi:hypothetical protein
MRGCTRMFPRIEPATSKPMPLVAPVRATGLRDTVIAFMGSSCLSSFLCASDRFVRRARTTRAIGTRRKCGLFSRVVPKLFQLHVRNRQCLPVILKHATVQETAAHRGQCPVPPFVHSRPRTLAWSRKVDSSSGSEVAARQWLAELLTREKNRCLLVIAPASALASDGAQFWGQAGTISGTIVGTIAFV